MVGKKFRPVGDTGTPLFVQVRDQLRAAILADELQPGERLPSESALIERFGVSRITIRQALSELQSMGLINTISGKGSYVTQPDRAPRGPFAGVLQSMRKRGYRVRGELLSHTVVPASETVAQALKIAQGTPIGAVRVLRYREDEPFAVGTTYLEPALAQRLAEQDLAQIDVASAMVVALGMRFGDVQFNVKAMLADASQAQSLACAIGSPILRVVTVSRDYDRHPKAFGITDGRGDIMDYRVTLRQDSPES